MHPMASESNALDVPLLLIAMPQVPDPFHRSVVLLVHHDSEGSLGFVVNRPTEIEMGEILRGMDLEWSGGGEAVAFFGGPVQPQLGTVLLENETGMELEGAVPVDSEIALTQHVADLERLAGSPPERVRLLLGYAGWGEDQLVEEILRNDWLTAPVSSDLIFSRDPVEAWESAVRSIGADPTSLPSWSPGAGDGGAN